MNCFKEGIAMARLGMFQMYDKDGIVEDYITYLLDDITKCLDEFIIIVCGEVKDEGLNKLKKYTNRIFVRDNYGFDAYAFKEAILNYLQPNELNNYDELVLFNDTFYGPFYPFKNIFDEMSDCDEDFWGLTKHARTTTVREHIQSYFLVIKKKMLHSKEFIDFWNQLDIGSLCFENLVYNYELHFTDYFSNKGYKYCAYVKDDDLNCDDYHNYNHYFLSPYRLIKYYKMPVIKKKVFTQSKNLNISAGEEIQEALDYIKENTNYNTEFIWSDLLRKSNLYDLKNNLNLNTIVPVNACSKAEINNAIVIAHLYYDELFEECINYLKNVPREIDILITTSKESIIEKAEKAKKSMKNLRTMKVENRGRDVAAIFVSCKDIVKKYEYVCFVHDKGASGKNAMFYTGASFQYLVWENMLASEGYIRNIISMLKEDNRLGLTCPPKPMHGDYHMVMTNEWTVNYNNCRELARKLNYKIQLQKDKPPYCLSTCFWCKREALDSLWNMDLKVENFNREPCKSDGEINHALERMLIYAAQDAGYYSIITMTPKYASLELQNKELLIRNPDDKIEERDCKVAFFAGKNEHVYVYGAGIESEKVTKTLKKIGVKPEAYVVTDEFYDNCKEGKLQPIIRYSDLPNDKSTAIIIGLNLQNTDDVIIKLRNDGYNNIFCFNERRAE